MNQLVNLVKQLTTQPAPARSRAANNNNRKSPKAQRNSSNRSPRLGAQVAMPMVGVANISQNSERVTGSDYLDSFHILSGDAGWQPGEVVESIIVTPDMTPRLASTTRRFQRIRWNSMRFKIDGGFSTMSSGQYAVAFVRDPTDLPAPGTDAIRWVTAQRGAQLSKWWQPTQVHVPRTPDLLWTSEEADKGGIRFSAPGTLVIICVNPPAQPGSITVWMDWDVTVSSPSVENFAEKGDLEPTITMTRDAALTWYPYDSAYAALRQTHAVASFDPTIHEGDARPLIDLASWGFGDVKAGDYLYADKPIQYMAQFTAGSGKVTSLVNTHLWKCDSLQTESTTTQNLCLTPMVRFLSADGSKYDVEYAGYVNSVGTGAYTWADIYSGLVILPAGTRFSKIDPQSHYEPEQITVYKSGKRVVRHTGRLVRAALPTYSISDYFPTVKTVSSGDSSNTVSNVRVVNNGGQPIPVASTALETMIQQGSQIQSYLSQVTPDVHTVAGATYNNLPSIASTVSKIEAETASIRGSAINTAANTGTMSGLLGDIKTNTGSVVTETTQTVDVLNDIKTNGLKMTYAGDELPVCISAATSSVRTVPPGTLTMAQPEGTLRPTYSVEQTVYKTDDGQTHTAYLPLAAISANAGKTYQYTVPTGDQESTTWRSLTSTLTVHDAYDSCGLDMGANDTN